MIFNILIRIITHPKESSRAQSRDLLLISEILADFQAFPDSLFYLPFYFFPAYIVHVFGSHHRQFTQSPEMPDRPYVWRGLFQCVPCVDVHPPCGDVQHLFTSAQPVALPVVASEGYVEQRHVLKEHFQRRRKAHVPERRGDDYPVGGRKPPRHVSISFRHNPVVPVCQDPASDCREIRPVKDDMFNFIPFAEFADERFRNPSRPGFLPHCRVYVKKFLHRTAF